MRVFAISDLHVDYEENARWVAGLSTHDYTHDLLILAGDISHAPDRFEWGLRALAQRFSKVVYVPGNHDLWVHRDPESRTSIDKLERIRALAQECGVSMSAYAAGSISIVPLLGWYDYSFAAPNPELSERWMDFRACRWPAGFDMNDVTAYFTSLNEPALATRNETIISFSHFLPRIDLMPSTIPPSKRFIYPVLGTNRLEEQIRQLRSTVHVYGHSHVNRRVTIDGIAYVNNAFGYPSEGLITSKSLVCIYEDGTTANGPTTVEASGKTVL